MSRLIRGMLGRVGDPAIFVGIELDFNRACNKLNLPARILKRAFMAKDLVLK